MDRPKLAAVLSNNHRETAVEDAEKGMQIKGEVRGIRRSFMLQDDIVVSHQSTKPDGSKRSRLGRAEHSDVVPQNIQTSRKTHVTSHK